MGHEEKKALAKDFEQKTQKSVKKIKEPGLFGGKTVEINLTVECFRDPQEALVEVGNEVRIIDMRDRIDVFIGLKSVGYVIAAESFRNILNPKAESGNAVIGRVIEVSNLTRTFMVLIH